MNQLHYTNDTWLFTNDDCESATWTMDAQFILMYMQCIKYDTHLSEITLQLERTHKVQTSAKAQYFSIVISPKYYSENGTVEN